MKVEHLIKKLQKFDPKVEVLCYCEDENIGSPIFEIAEISCVKAKKGRLSNGKPSLKFENGKLSKDFVIIGITNDV